MPPAVRTPRLHRKRVQATGDQLGDAVVLRGGKLDTDDAIARPRNLTLEVAERRQLQSHEPHRDDGLGDAHFGPALRQVGYGAREAVRPDLHPCPPAYLMAAAPSTPIPPPTAPFSSL